MLNIQIPDGGVAWYGAIVATASMFISYLNYHREKERIQVKYKRGMIVPDTPGYDIKKRYAVVDSVNLSNRPVTIKMVGAMNLDGLNGFILSNSLRDGQVTVEGGKNYVVIIEEDIVDWQKLEYFAAYTVTGGTYKAHVAPWQARLRWKFKRLFHTEPKTKK